MVLDRLVDVALAAFPISEVVLGLRRRARAGADTLADRGSLRLLWMVIVLAVLLGAVLAGLPWGRLPLARVPRDLLALALLAGGLALRWTAITTLGRLFTVNVAIREAHALVRHGPYRFVRHPSYTGMLIAFAGVGVTMGSWLSLAAILGPVTFAVLHRIGHEERALRQAFGAEYDAYAARTKKLVPGVV